MAVDADTAEGSRAHKLSRSRGTKMAISRIDSTLTGEDPCRIYSLGLNYCSACRPENTQKETKAERPSGRGDGSREGSGDRNLGCQ